MYKKKFTLRHVVEDFCDLTNEFSPVKELFGVPWAIRAKHVDDNFGLFFRCEIGDDVKKPWSVDVDYEFRVVSGKGLLTKSGTHKYKERTGWGWKDFRKWDYMCKNHVIDNTVTIECDVTIKSMTGIVRKRMMSFAYPKENLTDVILKVGEEKFHVLKGFLATHSPYFNALFFANFSESKQSEIELKDVDPEDFQQLLEAIHGALFIESDNVEVLLYLTDRFDVPIIRTRCEKFLLNCSDITNRTKLRIADAYHLEDVKEHCLKDVKTAEDVKKLVPTDVRELDHSTLAKLLEITLATH